jgi:hypothetical protein
MLKDLRKDDPNSAGFLTSASGLILNKVDR